MEAWGDIIRDIGESLHRESWVYKVEWREPSNSSPSGTTSSDLMWRENLCRLDLRQACPGSGCVLCGMTRLPATKQMLTDVRRTREDEGRAWNDAAMRISDHLQNFQTCEGQIVPWIFLRPIRSLTSHVQFLKLKWNKFHI